MDHLLAFALGVMGGVSAEILFENWVLRALGRLRSFAAASLRRLAARL